MQPVSRVKDHGKDKSKLPRGRTSGKKKRFAGIGDFCYFCMLMAFLEERPSVAFVRCGECNNWNNSQ